MKLRLYVYLFLELILAWRGDCTDYDFKNVANHTYYKLKRIKLGVEVQGISLQTDPPAHVIEQIKSDVTTHSILLFKHQGVISGERQLQISRWFGEVEKTRFPVHFKSPHQLVYRLSNDRQEGVKGIGLHWHIDGSFESMPHAYSIYHIVQAPRRGGTVFAPMTDVIESLPREKREKWERLWMVCTKKGAPPRPLVFSHPITGKPVMCFHLLRTAKFIWDYGTEQERHTGIKETKQILEEIREIYDNETLQYHHHWETGDLMITDNLSVAHHAHPDSQLPPSEVGLRVLHRTTVESPVRPEKSINTLPHDPSAHKVKEEL